MTWLDSSPPLQESSPDILPEDLAVAREYGVDVSTAPEPGPAIETRELLRRLYRNVKGGELVPAPGQGGHTGLSGPRAASLSR